MSRKYEDVEETSYYYDLPTEHSTADEFSYHRQPMKKVVRFDSLSPEEQKALERDYYKSYDVNDGIRTAAALGGFISLFMLFVIYKTKCKSKKKYLSTSENLPFEDGRTSQDVSNIFSNTSSMKGSNLLLHPPEGFQSPTSACGSQPTRTPRVSQSSCEGVSYHVISLGDGGTTSYSHECSSAAGTSSRDHAFRVMSPTDSINWYKYDDNKRSCQRYRPTGPSQHSTNLLQEANINIQVIQPTPNITPRGSLRIDSPDSGDDPNNLRMIIPLLTPVKTSKGFGHQGRRKSESPFLECVQHRVSFDGQSVGSDNVFVGESEECEMSSVDHHKKGRKSSTDSKRYRKKKRKSNEETYC